MKNSLVIKVKRVSYLELMNTLCALYLLFRYAFTFALRLDFSIVVKYGIVTIWIVTACLTDKKLFYKSRKTIIALFILFVLNIILLLTSGSSYNFIRFRSQTFFFFFWQIMFEYYKEKDLRVEKLAVPFIFLYAISCFLTIRGNLLYLHASRQLAGLADSATTAKYYSMGIGGYGFIYFSVFIIPVLYLILKRKILEKNNILLAATIILAIVTLIVSDYTTAVFMAVLLLAYSIFFTSEKHRYLYMVIVIALLVLVLMFFSQILEGIKDYFRGINSYMIVRRIEELQLASRSGGAEIERIVLYKNGLMNFFDRPFWGVPQDYPTLRYSNHSEIICYLERFGIFGFIYPFILIADYSSVIKKIQNNTLKSFYKMMMIMLVILAAINRVDTSPEISLAVYLITPLMLICMDRHTYLSVKS